MSYSLSDPIAALACNTSLDLFESRCWSSGSLMQNAIGLDHLAATLKRFNRKRRASALCRRVGNWLRSVNLDTTDLLEEVINLSASARGYSGSGFQRAILALGERETATRLKLLSAGSALRAELEIFPLAARPTELQLLSGPRLRLARQAAVAVLALGMPALSGCQSGVSEMAPPPLKDTQTPPQKPGADQEGRCSLVGDVTDPSGAVIANATVTIANLDTGLTHTVKTNELGHYVAGGLALGRYSVKAESPGFRPSKRPASYSRQGPMAAPMSLSKFALTLS